MMWIQKVFKTMTHYFKRFTLILLVNILLMGIAFWQFTAGEILTAFTLLWGIPISRIFTFGRIRNRLVNGLTFIVIFIYLLLGVRFGLWDEASYLLMVTPYLSLIIKPSRTWVKYLAVAISTLYLIYGLVSGNQVSFFIKAASIGFVYVVFFPSILKSTLKSIRTRRKN